MLKIGIFREEPETGFLKETRFLTFLTPGLLPFVKEPETGFLLDLSITY